MPTYHVPVFAEIQQILNTHVRNLQVLEKMSNLNRFLALGSERLTSSVAAGLNGVCKTQETIEGRQSGLPGTCYQKAKPPLQIPNLRIARI
jgi:hypothetical protein